MNLDELRTEWNQQNNHINKKIGLNKRAIEKIQLDKSKNMMERVIGYRITEVIVFLLMLTFLWNYIIAHFSLSAPMISAAVLVVFAIIGFSGNIGQIVLIAKIDYSDSVKKVQTQLHAIRSHALFMVKLTLLSIPFYMAYITLGFEVFWGIDLFIDADSRFIILNLIFSLALIIPTTWLYKQLNFNNVKVAWVRRLSEQLCGAQLVIVSDFLAEIDN